MPEAIGSVSSRFSVARLEQARELLNGHVGAPVKRGRTASSTTRHKQTSQAQDGQRRGTGKNCSSAEGEMGEGEEVVGHQSSRGLKRCLIS
jgi:hypothetical protein